jgi:hypothetical protein
MDQHLIFDGFAPLGEANLREVKLKRIILEVQPQAAIEACPTLTELLVQLKQKSPTIVYLHHSEIQAGGLRSKDFPEQHFYIHYSGAGFTTCPPHWDHFDHHFFLHESIDSDNSESFEPLKALLDTLRHIQPAPPVGHWLPQLKTITFTPYKSARQSLVGHFPRWLADAWVFHMKNQHPSRDEFKHWAANAEIVDGSTPGPLTIEAAWKRFLPAPNLKIKSVFEHSSTPSQKEQIHSKLKHDFKYLLYAIKDGDRERFKKLWHENFTPDLLTWSQQNKVELHKLELEKVTAWIQDQSSDAQTGKKIVQTLRDRLDDLLQPYQPEKHNLENADPCEEPFQALPCHHELKYPPNGHSPRLWCVGPRQSSAQKWKDCLLNLKAGRRPLNLSQCCFDEHHQFGDLLHQLRQTNPRELFHTLLLVDVGQQLREALNAGRTQHALSAEASWTSDNQLQMGIITRLVSTFPHMGLIILHDSEPSELREIIRQEFLSVVPKSDLDPEKLIEPLIQQHFFNLKTDAQACATACANFIEGQRHLFDPTGLRTFVKLRLIANIFSGATHQGQPELEHTLTQRKVLASRLEQVLISVDEDISSTLFHAYAGYRYGYRAWTVTSFHQFDQPHLWQSPAIKHLVIRDTDLRFPDIDGRENLRDAKSQGSVRQRLESVYSDLWQWLPENQISSATKDNNQNQLSSATEGNNQKQNQSSSLLPKLGQHWKVRAVAATGTKIRLKPWLGSSELENRLGEIQGQQDQPCVLGLPKPLTSLYDLSQLMDWPTKTKPSTIASRLTPPARLNSAAGHYAPYINLPLAAELLVQAKSLQGEDELDWLIGAILALEADEMLLGMSEYTGLDAVRWLHRCEVRAEIRSVGFSGLIHIQPRKKELQSLVKARYRDNSLSQDHFLSRLWDDLRTLYKSSEQFYASEESNIESFCKRKWMGHHHMGHHIEEFLRRWFIMSASSIWAWLSSLVISTLGLWGLYGMFLPTDCIIDPMFGFKVFMSSLMGEPAFGFSDTFSLPFNFGLKVVIILHFSVSYLLFGFFLSMVYRRITRS